jgi:translation initiation factor 1
MPGLFDGTSLEQPVTCERCGKAPMQCPCPRDRLSGKVLNPAEQQLRVQREKRGGKTITIVQGFAPRSDRTDDLPALLKQLKSTLAAGGSLDPESSRGPTIEFQGDHRDRLVEFFKKLGYPAKPSGG